MLPNFLGIGAARAGTTWLARNLMQHPDIFIPTKKELHFFDSQYNAGIAVYEDEFRDWQGEPAIGEITPQYLHNEVVAERIYNALPEVKLLVCLRHPIERAYSHYWKSKASFPDPTNATFEEKLDQLPEITEIGFYYKHLVRYLAFSPREHIHILLHDDVQDKPKEALQQVYRFLCVDDSFQSPLIHAEINIGASQGNLAKSKSAWHFQRLLMRCGLYNFANRIERVNRQKIPTMNPAIRSSLATKYREQTLQLQDLLGRDLHHWLQ